MEDDEGTAENAIVASIAAVPQAWLDAVRDSDVEQLGKLVTDDTVVVHANGRCVCGRDDLKADFRKDFDAFSVEQSISSPEIIVGGRRALEISEAESTRLSGESTHVHSTTVVAQNQQSDGTWKVGRLLGLVHAPPPL